MHYRYKRVAIPKKVKKPTTSVTVVKITEPDSAASWLNFCSTIGTTTPAIAATAMLIKIAQPITMPMVASPNHQPATKPITIAHKNPLTMPIPSSFFINENKLPAEICPMAIPRIISVND